MKKALVGLLLALFSQGAFASTLGKEKLELSSDLQEVISLGNWDEAEWGVMVVSLDAGDTLFSHNPGAALIPASNMKLFTVASALYYLGADFSYTTFLTLKGRERGGILEGDLILYGTGDPAISGRYFSERIPFVMEAFADSLYTSGIRRIMGNVVGDASYFVGKKVGNSWKESYMNEVYASPAAALSYNNNLVTLVVSPGDLIGAPANIKFIPEIYKEALDLENATITTNRKTNPLKVKKLTFDGPIMVLGEVPMGSGETRRAIPVSNPALFAAAALHQALEERGIEVEGGIQTVYGPEQSAITGTTTHAYALEEGQRGQDAFPGQLPAGEWQNTPLQTLFIHKSPPLIEILNVINKESHNFYADMVWRTVGRIAEGEGSIEGSSRAVRKFALTVTGLDSLDLKMDDGSGLSVGNRASAATFIALLSGLSQEPYFEHFRQTLPVAAEHRRLRRMGGTPAAGNLAAKTGTIDSVSALSGYVHAANGELLAFSIISNSVPSTYSAKRREDRMGARLAAFTRTHGEADSLGSALNNSTTP